MYKRLKNSLLFPKQLVDYMDEKPIITWLYFIVFMLLATIPSVISVCSSTQTSYLSGDYASAFSESNLTCKVENGTLIQESNDYEYVGINYQMSYLETKLLFVFDASTNTYTEDALTMMSETGIFVICNKTNVHVGIRYMMDINIYNFTYEELGISNADLTVSTAKMEEQAGLLINGIYQGCLKRLLPISIISTIISSVIESLASILLLALLIKLIYRFFEIKYSDALKAVMLSSLPYFILLLLANLFNIYILSLVGDLIMCFYASKLIFNYMMIHGKGKKIIIKNINNMDPGDIEDMINAEFTEVKEDKKDNDNQDDDEDEEHR